jgi:small-conductance mechanosensitive channel
MSEMSEAIQKAHEGAHGEGFNKRIALVIAILALFLSFSETLGKSAQTEAIDANVKSSDLWAFFQAKTIRRTQLLTAVEQAQLQEPTVTDSQAKAALEKQIANWQKTAALFDSDPKSREGRKELTARARAAEENRDLSMAKYHHYELASAAFQVGIVLASATVITGIVVLAWFAGALGAVGLALLALGLFAPHLMEAFL